LLARGFPTASRRPSALRRGDPWSPGVFLPRPGGPLPPVGATLGRPVSQNWPDFIICAPVALLSSLEAAPAARARFLWWRLRRIIPLGLKSATGAFIQLTLCVSWNRPHSLLFGRECAESEPGALSAPLDSQRKSRIHLPPGSSSSVCMGNVVRQNPRGPLLRGVQSTPTIAISLRYFSEVAEHTSKPTARPSEGGTHRVTADGF
jgi:hypothetical protein